MKKLNLIKILKDCPKGTKFYSPVYGKIEFIGIETYASNPDPITIKWFKDENTTYLEYLRADGTFRGLGECIIFPSEDQRDWSKWQRPFVKGDILVSEVGNIVLCSHIDETQLVHYHCILNFLGILKICDDVGVGYSYNCTLANDFQKQKLLDALKKEGYEWNPETKTLEKLIVPKFKVGDKIRHRLTGEVYMVLFVLSNGYGDGVYDVSITNEIGKSIEVKEQDDYELVLNKFDINTLKPFDKVLVRDNNTSIWINAFFGFYDIEITKKYPFVASGINWTQCIPYEGNEHLLGTTNDCDDFYKTWEE